MKKLILILFLSLGLSGCVEEKINSISESVSSVTKPSNNENENNKKEEVKIVKKELKKIEKKVLNKKTEGISDNLSNKGLICRYLGPFDRSSHIGYWFKNDTEWEKWFNLNMSERSDGFEFVKTDRKLYKFYKVYENSIYLHYSKTKGSKIFKLHRYVNRTNLRHYHSDIKEYVGNCKVVNGKDKFLNELKLISDQYREQHNNKLKDRKI